MKDLFIKNTNKKNALITLHDIFLINYFTFTYLHIFITIIITKFNILNLVKCHIVN